jgi:hypothetical protein
VLILFLRLLLLLPHDPSTLYDLRSTFSHILSRILSRISHPTYDLFTLYLPRRQAWAP